MAKQRIQPTTQQFTAYQAMYDYLNAELFAGGLPSVILNFSRRGKTYGFFAPCRWDDGSTVTHEISLNPSHLKDRPALEVGSTLAHEMCHLWQHVHGKPSRTGYHNLEWAGQMQSIGLVPSDTGQPGGKKTGQHMTHYIEAGGGYGTAFASMPAAYRLPWQCIPEGEGPQRGNPGRGKVKYSCPNGHGNAWGKPELALICGVCGDEYSQES